jgi:plastocyanin
LTTVPTPERSTGRSGVFVSLLALLAIVGCEAVNGGGGATIQLDTAEVQLAGAHVHDFVIAGQADTDSIAPAAVRVQVGDAVRFTTGDHRTHAMAFDADRLDPPIREYLERTNQLRGPPLVNRGASWVVVLEDAPPGRYPFLCRSHDARGVVVVGRPD